MYSRSLTPSLAARIVHHLFWPLTLVAFVGGSVVWWNVGAGGFAAIGVWIAYAITVNVFSLDMPVCDCPDPNCRYAKPGPRYGD